MINVNLNTTRTSPEITDARTKKLYLNIDIDYVYQCTLDISKVQMMRW